MSRERRTVQVSMEPNEDGKTFRVFDHGSVMDRTLDDIKRLVAEGVIIEPWELPKLDVDYGDAWKER